MPNQSNTQNKFLSTLLEGIPPGHHLLVAEHKLNKAGQTVFPAKPWTGQELTGAWYFSCGGSENPRRRRREDVTHVRALVIDDVGTKVQKSAVLAPPSWVMETSEGNFQYGYLLPWLDDLAGHDALNAALTERSLQDKGAQGVNRLSRLPMSLNVKPDRAEWLSVLREWHPDRVYSTIDELAAALGVEIHRNGGRTRRSSEVTGAPRQALLDSDPIFAWLDQQGMVRRAKSDGWYEIQCPLADEHQGDPRDDASYLPIGATEDGHRAVQCFHSHGATGDYPKRVYAWIVEQGGPAPGAPHEVAIPQHVQAMLARLQPKPPTALKEARTAPPEATPPAAPPAAPKGTTERYTAVEFIRLLENGRKINRHVLPDLDLTKEGQPKQAQPSTIANVEALVARWGLHLEFNLMTTEVRCAYPPHIDPERIPGWGRSRINTEMAWLINAMSPYGMRNDNALREHLHLVAWQNTYHPMLEWLEAAPWDGQDRFEGLLASIHTPRPDVARVFLHRWLLQTIEAAAGWRSKRFLAKELVLVLVGAQGIGKTRWIKALAPGMTQDNVSLHLSGHSARDSIHHATQAPIVELGEIGATFRKSDKEDLKGFLSQAWDSYRLPYGRTEIHRPRCTSFAGSVNDDQFLHDETGNRRFLPVPCDLLVVEHGVDMQQLWAQYHVLWQAGERHYLTAAEADMQRDYVEAEHFQPANVVALLEARLSKVEFDRGPEGVGVYNIECWLNAAQIAGLLLPGQALSPQVSHQVASYLTKHLGKPRDTRRRGGPQRAWRIMLMANEVNREMGLTPLGGPPLSLV